MTRQTVIRIRVLYALVIILAVWLIYPAFRRAKSHGGPSPQTLIRMHLEMIDETKEALKRKQGLPEDYWPTRTEIAIAYSAQTAIASTTGTNASFDSRFRQSRWGEIYIVNKIGAPALAYLTNAVAGFPEGCLLTSEDLLPGAQLIGPANGRQPVRSETNRTSSAAASRR
jgi:ABC-type nitrate/sulfonate/bicarbonate transport system permease component